MAKIQKSPQPFGKLAFSPKLDHLLFTTPMNTLFCLYSEAFSLYNPTYPPIYNLFQNQKSTNSASTSKIQPTTLPTFFLVCLQVSEKSGVMKENCWTVGINFNNENWHNVTALWSAAGAR
jgi:hypothetical protein